MINLKNGQARAAISPEGAWVESLEVGDVAIFFPKTQLTNSSSEAKLRGGMHVCLPNFGPGGDSGLAQHGFGRTSLWNVAHQTDTSVTLELEHNDVRYQGLHWTLVYVLTPQSFSVSLRAQNNGGFSSRIAPGFHPYFYLDESETAVMVNEAVHELHMLSGTKFSNDNSIHLKTAHKTIHLKQQGLPLWAFWTDQLANYVCIEPTFGGYRFLERAVPNEQITPGTSKEFSFSINW